MGSTWIGSSLSRLKLSPTLGSASATERKRWEEKRGRKEKRGRQVERGRRNRGGGELCVWGRRERGEEREGKEKKGEGACVGERGRERKKRIEMKRKEKGKGRGRKSGTHVTMLVVGRR
jgi:hypothetical protein